MNSITNIIYINTETGEFSPDKSEFTPTPIAGRMINHLTCQLEHCHWFILSQIEMLLSLKTVAGKICLLRGSISETMLNLREIVRKCPNKDKSVL